jgi:hypothetical protein
VATTSAWPRRPQGATAPAQSPRHSRDVSTEFLSAQSDTGPLTANARAGHPRALASQPAGTETVSQPRAKPNGVLSQPPSVPPKRSATWRYDSDSRLALPQHPSQHPTMGIWARRQTTQPRPTETRLTIKFFFLPNTSYSHLRHAETQLRALPRILLNKT